MGDAITKAGMCMHIVFRSLRLLHRDFKVDHFVIACDGGSWRKDVYPAYKSSRVLARQIATEQEREDNEIFFEALNVMTDFLREKTRCTVLWSKDIEADDFIGRWTQLHPEDGHFIVSSDSDFVQLLAPNVHIYDGVQNRMLTTTGITNDKGQNLSFTLKSADGKIKIGPADPSFVPEDEWWRKALFVKLVRGDVGDCVFSCFPRVSFKPTTKNISIEQAWQDRKDQGFYWSNFMYQEWSKLMGADENGDPITKMVRVIDEYRINEGLIDLTKQPDKIKAQMDEAIAKAVQKTPPSMVGIAFLKFCKRHALENLIREANDHGVYLNAGYAQNKETTP